MATTPASSPPAARVLQPMPQSDGTLVFGHRLTSKDRTDLVQLHVGPVNVLPIVFVPGVMGSNLKVKGKQKEVWRLDTVFGDPYGLALGKLLQNAGKRQKLLHPERTEVDPEGNVPKKEIGTILSTGDQSALAAAYRQRGWGEVAEGSYQDFLILLEDTLNGHRKGQPKSTDVEAKVAALMALRADDPSNQPWRPEKGPAESAPGDFAHLRQWVFPVYACGYNWLEDNALAAQRLQQRIGEAMAQNNHANARCEQVILITHSMGGLVARVCQQMDGMEAKIAGIVHGVMPADGAPVAYRRCKLGMTEEDRKSAIVIGRTGQEVTAVFAQAPGALELLPTHRYKGGWLEVRGPDGKTVQKMLHESDPYEEVYARRDRWWALIKEEWLQPKDGAPITFEQYLGYLRNAKKFHQALTPNSYHPNTYAFYGADSRGKTRSFERIVWQMTRGRGADDKVPPPEAVYDMSPQQVQLDGVNPEYVGWKQTIKAEPHSDGGVEFSVDETSQWELRAGLADGTGDGTVPSASGRRPADCAKVRQVFRLSGVTHEPAYSANSPVARQVTLYAISKIVLEARLPKGNSSAAARG